MRLLAAWIRTLQFRDLSLMEENTFSCKLETAETQKKPIRTKVEGRYYEARGREEKWKAVAKCANTNAKTCAKEGTERSR